MWPTTTKWLVLPTSVPAACRSCRGFMAWCVADWPLACEGDTRACDNVAARMIAINRGMTRLRRMLVPLTDVQRVCPRRPYPRQAPPGSTRNDHIQTAAAGVARRWVGDEPGQTE